METWDKDLHHVALVQDEHNDNCNTCTHVHEEMDHDMLIDNEEGAVKYST